MTLSTQFHHLTADTKLIALIEKRFKRLQQMFERISNANVVLHLRKTGDPGQMMAEIKIALPEKVLFVRESAQSLEASIDKAINVLRMLLSKIGPHPKLA